MRALAILALLLPCAAAGADEITDQIDQARAYYEEGDIGGAVAELEFTLQALRGKLAEALLATFPAPPDGWTAEDADGDAAAAAGLLGGSVIQRTYRQAGGGSIEVRLMSGGGMLQGIAAMMLSPQVLAARPGARRIRVGRDNGMLVYEPSDRTAQLVLDLGGRTALMMEGRGLAGPEPLEALLDAWDIGRLKQVAGI